MAAGNPYLDDAPATGGNPYLDDTPAPTAAPAQPPASRSSSVFGDKVSDQSLSDLITGKRSGAAKQWGFQEYATDGFRSLLNGIGKGVAGVAGLPADALRLGQAGLDYSQSIGQGRDYEAVSAENRNRGAVGIPDVVAQRVAEGARTLGSENIQANLPTQYDPQSRAGKFISEAANFATQGAALPLGAGRAAAAGVGAVAGLGSEAGGQLTEGTAAEPYARLAGALAGGGVSAYAGRASGAEQAATASLRSLPENEREAILARAQTLMGDAQASGVPLSAANAIDAASNGVTDLSGLQRHVEALGGMRGFYAGAGERTDAAARQVFDAVAPTPTAPSVIGPQAGRAAEEIVTDANRARTAAVADDALAARSDTVDPSSVESLVKSLDERIAADTTGLSHGPLRQMRDSLVTREAREAVPAVPGERVPINDPKTGRIVRYEMTPGTPEIPAVPREYAADVENLDRVRKYFRDRTELPAFAPDAIDKETGAVVGRAAGTIDQALSEGSEAYARRNADYSRISREIVEPLMQGPIGKLANSDLTTQQAISTLFPSNPLPNSQGEIAGAVGALAGRNPWAARQLVRAHAEGVFNEAAQNLMTGPNANGGAKFASVYRGNAQQAANQDAAIRALPNGDAVADGFNRLLDVFEAMGRRQNVGSRTAYNAEELARMKQGGPVERLAANLASGGIKLPARIVAKIEEWRLGRNLDQLADLFTRPDAVAAFRGLAGQGDPTGALGRLAGLAIRSQNQPQGALQLRVQPRTEDR
jgi:hypothetical protein